MRTALLIVVSLLFSQLAWSANELTAILSLRKGAEISKEDLRKIMSHREVKNSRDVFSGAEKNILRKMKAEHLAKAWVLELRNETSFDILEKQIRRSGMPLNLDWNDMKVARLSMDPFQKWQWGLSNQGIAQSIDLDPMVSYRIPARGGEDVHRPALLKTGKKVLVAVLDTGVDKEHPDLKSVIHRNESECKALEKFLSCVQEKDRKECEKKWMDPKNKEVDQDGNGYPMDCQGWSILGGNNSAGIMGRPDFTDDQGHGTHVTGLIAAENGNGIGVAGVSTNVEILPVQVLGEQPSEPMKPLSVDLSPLEEARAGKNKSLGDMVARGVIYAIRSGAQVINFSMGWPQARDSQFMREVIAEAQSRGIIVVAAAGNDSTSALLRPCAYPGVLCVGATGPDGALAHFSNHGVGVDLNAPGVNMLSTYPLANRPVRFRETLGYEFLSGTSQAAPLVTGAVAELIARGIPAEEVYPRLILSSRETPQKLPLLQGLPHEGGKSLSADREPYKKMTIGGNMDVAAALVQAPQPLIVPSSKEKKEIIWNRQDRELTYEFSLKNLWQAVEMSAVQINVQFARPSREAVRPEIVSLEPIGRSMSTWKPGEEHSFRVKFSINDTSDIADSRIPSELEFAVSVGIAGQAKTRDYVLGAELIVAVTPELTGSDVQTIPVLDFPKGRLSFLPIDQNLDGVAAKRDYFAVQQDKGNWQMWLVSQASTDSAYKTIGGTKIKIEGDDNKLREQILARIDLNKDGKSEYVLGVMEDKSEDDEPGPSPYTFFVFDQAMKLKESFSYDGKLSQMPYEVHWMSVAGRLRPVWVGPGRDPDRKRTLRDRWENKNDDEKQEMRFYWLNEKHQLKALKEHEGYRIIDIIQPRASQLQQGRVPVLMAKNLGTEAKPSYLYSFAVGEMYEGKIENFKEMSFFSQGDAFRNLLDTRVDKVQSLDPQGEEIQGSYWFSEGLNRQQRLSVYETANSKFTDVNLSAMRTQVDSALWIRAVFAGAKRQGAFVLTNSEIQYHDLKSGEVVSTSFERYTFYPDMLMTNLYFPLVLKDKQNPNAKLPALFTTESSELNRGVKMLVPVFASGGRLIEVVSPARLRLMASGGCRPMETPVFQGSEGSALDYYCRDRIVRVRLGY